MPHVRRALAAAALLSVLVQALPVDASRSRQRGADRGPGLAPSEAPELSLRDEMVLVLPFAAEEGAEPAWLSAGLAELVAEGVRLAGYRTAEPETRTVLLQELGLDRAPRLTLASACVAGREAGARIVVTGSWAADSGQGLAIHARALDVDRVHLLREAEASGPLSAAGALLGRLVLELTGDAGREPEARRQLEKLLAAPGPALLAWMQAAGEPDVAEEHLEAALEVDPDFPPAVLALAERRLDDGRPEDVPALLGRLPAGLARAQQARARLLDGRASLALGDVATAVSALGEAARLHPDRESLLWLGEAQLLAGDETGASASARRALDLTPGDAHALDLLDRASSRRDS